MEMNKPDKSRIDPAILAPLPTNGPRNYENSRILDVHKVSDYPEIKEIVDGIYEAYFEDQKSRVTKKHIETVVLNLLANYKTDPELYTAVQLSPNKYKANSRYNKLHISRKTIDVVHRLIKVGLIGIKNGWEDPESKKRYMSRIWPTDALIQIFEDGELELNHVGMHPDRETIILKDEEKHLIEYDDTDETRCMRENLKRYNDLLAETDICIPQLNESYIELPKKAHRIYISTDHYIRRVFNNIRWDHGGRFYGGFWQRIPSEFRKKIHINGQPTIELDYSGLHIVLLYRLEGIDYWKEINRDPYQIQTNEWDRWFIKTFLLTAINAKDETSSFKAMRQAHNDEYGFYPSIKDWQFRRLLNLIRNQHKPIDHKLCSGAGLELMNLDSRITEYIVMKFTQSGIPILTIHDSYIVQYRYEDDLRILMQEAINKFIGTTTILIK